MIDMELQVGFMQLMIDIELQVDLLLLLFVSLFSCKQGKVRSWWALCTSACLQPGYERHEIVSPLLTRDQ